MVFLSLQFVFLFYFCIDGCLTRMFLTFVYYFLRVFLTAIIIGGIITQNNKILRLHMKVIYILILKRIMNFELCHSSYVIKASGQGFTEDKDER